MCLPPKAEDEAPKAGVEEAPKAGIELPKAGDEEAPVEVPPKMEPPVCAPKGDNIRGRIHHHVLASTIFSFKVGEDRRKSSIVLQIKDFESGILSPLIYAFANYDYFYLCVLDICLTSISSVVTPTPLQASRTTHIFKLGEGYFHVK
ncbi:hypothetical protein LXL04_000646 [Taraxacum kok-saghyz]